MTTGQTETIEIHKTILGKTADGSVVAGDSHVDNQGRWVVQLTVGTARHLIDLLEGDTFEVNGGTWRVAKVYEPTTVPRDQWQPSRWSLSHSWPPRAK